MVVVVVVIKMGNRKLLVMVEVRVDKFKDGGIK